ncbi:methyltransferase [Frondihabitans cladoniiphilus]|uniref:Methyltransferase n=1 Tax=Frondihabitans cladoniiphilus TaxID=715785 RepID=A0ABP8VQW8_9MICO
MSDTRRSTPDTDPSERIWVASGPAGVVGSIHRSHDGFSIRVRPDDEFHGEYPTLDVAKSALHARLGHGADRPEFVEH